MARPSCNRLSSCGTAAVATLTAILILFSSSLAQGDADVIKIDSTLVLMNATVTDRRGEPVLTLTKDDFVLFEDGKRQGIEIFETREAPFAAVVLLDTSGSMEKRVSLARSAAIRFLDGLRAGDSAAIYNFDSKVRLVQEFSGLRDLVPQVYDLKAYGWTVLNDAIFRAALDLKKRPERRRAIIVLSDGADTKSGRSASKALRAALDANATIYTVDMSRVNTGGKQRMQNRGVLKKFARQTGGRFVETPGGVEMRRAFEQIVKELGVQYTIGYYPSNTKRDGKWREIRLKAGPAGSKVRTRKGYNAPRK